MVKEKRVSLLSTSVINWKVFGEALRGIMKPSKLTVDMNKGLAPSL